MGKDSFFSLFYSITISNAISSVAWNEFARKLAYKSEWNGKNIVFIGRFEPNSKACSKCGYVNSELKLSDREWVCPNCGEHHDRDINAAKNILTFGLHPQALVGKENKITAVTGMDTDGEGNDISHPVKRQDSKHDIITFVCKYTKKLLFMQYLYMYKHNQ